MDDIPNRTLALLLVGAIVVSLSATIYTLNTIQRGLQVVPTGRAPTDTGNITVKVDTSLSIRLITPYHIVNFGSGFVNRTVGTEPYCATNATLYAGATYNDSDNVRSCWTNYTAQPTSLRLENDGNVNVNVTVRGPANDSFFSTYSGSLPYGTAWKARNIDSNACRSGSYIQSDFIEFGGEAKTVCGNLSFIPSSNELGIDIKLVVPADINPGKYENASIEFTAYQQV